MKVFIIMTEDHILFEPHYYTDENHVSKRVVGKSGKFLVITASMDTLHLKTN
jgi:hypothetical protein